MYHTQDGSITAIVRPFNWLLVNEIDGTIWFPATFTTKECGGNQTTIQIFTPDAFTRECLHGSSIDILKVLDNVKHRTIRLTDLLSISEVSPIHAINALLERGVFHTYSLLESENEVARS